MDELPADATVTVDSARISPGNAMPDGADSAELLDIDVDEFTWLLAFIAPDRLSWLQSTQLVKAQAPKDAADGRRRDPDLRSDLLARVALSAQSLDHGARGGRRLVWR